MAIDSTQQRLVVKRSVQQAFQQNWQFKLEIEGQPTDFALFVKDVTYGLFTINTNPILTGASFVNLPHQAEPGLLTVTLRDHQDRRIHRWLLDWIANIKNPDGTLNPPLHPKLGYVRQLQLLQLTELNNEQLINTFLVYPNQAGEITESYTEPGFLEFSVTFTKFR
ncbi:hypothetical protein [Spartinivicinus poritis]|uniref:Uncharacterized protein n=1 Tax=Spartinivicinus poritis TaxID=2994640 RepID=A0ABT5UGG8_9GAMM|nr:hypothetical protein [Spartinivicinus sp. A2-2]MDE1465091.1 hypothetical protein [Spartinivicinus sp. A2-2]